MALFSYLANRQLVYKATVNHRSVTVRIHQLQLHQRIFCLYGANEAKVATGFHAIVIGIVFMYAERQSATGRYRLRGFTYVQRIFASGFLKW